MSSEVLNNIILLADCYKATHYLQYPPGTQTIYSYFESRGGRFPYTLFFGLQYIVKKWLTGKVVTEEKINEAKKILLPLFGNRPIFHEKGWNYILKEHNGYLPIRIKAVPEGTVVPTKNVLFTVENTDPNVPWLTSYLETLLVEVWYPSTVATISRIQKQIIYKYMTETCDNTDSLGIKLHDFGFRGVSSVESAAIGGAAHLVNFKGSDNIIAIAMLREYYNCPVSQCGIVASEHSTVTIWEKKGELDAMKNILQAFPEGIVAMVCDSYDVYHACEQFIGKDLHDAILERGKKDNIVVIRPDSGDPPTVLLKILSILEKYFEISVNTKGFKVMPDYLRLLQGDGIDYSMINKILFALKSNSWAAENVLFGSGGALLQKLNRDTQKFAYKCSYAVINDKGINVFKDPITDRTKKSKKGKLTLAFKDGFITTEEGTGSAENDMLKTIFENGVLLQDYAMEDIRKRAEISHNDCDIFQILDLNSEVIELPE